jgi:hypothetical protein
MSVIKKSSKKQMSIAACTRAQFSSAVKAGKLIRTAFSRLLFNIGDPHVSARLGAVMLKVVQTDVVHEYGQKTAGSGDLRLLNGFEFNNKKLMGKHFYVPFEAQVDRNTGLCTLQLPLFKPKENLRTPFVDGHFRLVLAAGCFDFENETYCMDIQTSDYYSMRQATEISLRAQLDAHCQQPVVLLLGLQYYKKVNDQYLLSYSGGPMALRVVHTDQLFPLPMKS